MSKQTAPKPVKPSPNLNHGKVSMNLFRPKSSIIVQVEEILPVEGAPWNVCQTRYREFPKFEKHWKLETRLSSYWNLYGRNPSSSEALRVCTDTAVKREAQKICRWTGQQTASRIEWREASIGRSSERKHPASCFGFAMLTHFPTCAEDNISHRPPLPLHWTKTNQSKLFG